MCSLRLTGLGRALFPGAFPQPPHNVRLGLSPARPPLAGKHQVDNKAAMSETLAYLRGSLRGVGWEGVCVSNGARAATVALKSYTCFEHQG